MKKRYYHGTKKDRKNKKKDFKNKENNRNKEIFKPTNESQQPKNEPSVNTIRKIEPFKKQPICYLRGKLVNKDDLIALHDLLESSNINLDDLVNLLEKLFLSIFDNQSNENITLREKTGLIEETLKIFELKKSKKYILLRLKVLDLLIKIKENTFIPLTLEIVKIIDEVLNHEPTSGTKHITGYKINEEKWDEEINNQLFKKILRLAYKYFNKYSNNPGFIDLIFYINNKFKDCVDEEVKGLLDVLNVHKEYLEKNLESNNLMRIEELKNMTK